MLHRRNFLALLIVIVQCACLPAKLHAEKFVDESGVCGMGVVNALNAIIEAREGLKRWTLHAKAERKTHAADEPAKTELVAAVDLVTHQYRYETHGRIRIGISSSAVDYSQLTPDERKKSQKSRDAVSLIVQNRKMMLEWYGIGDQVKNFAESATCHIEFRDVGTRPTYLASAAFNPQVVGLAQLEMPSLTSSVEEAIHRYLLRASSVELQPSEGPEIKILFQYPKSGRAVLVVNPQNGYTVSHAGFFVVDEKNHEVPLPRYEADAKWALKSGEWVPREFSCRSVKKDGETSEVKYEVTWDSVNPPEIDSKAFDYRTFDGFWSGLSTIERRNGLLKQVAPETDKESGDRDN